MNGGFMSVCPICEWFARLYPFRKFEPHPYYIKMADGRIYVTPPEITAMIDYDKQTARAQAVKEVVAKHFPLKVKW